VVDDAATITAGDDDATKNGAAGAATITAGDDAATKNGAAGAKAGTTAGNVARDDNATKTGAGDGVILVVFYVYFCIHLNDTVLVCYILTICINIHSQAKKPKFLSRLKEAQSA